MVNDVSAAREAAREGLERVGIVGPGIRAHLLGEIVNKVLLRRGSDPVLLQGCSGSGKEKAAQAIHWAAQAYLERLGVYSIINCATLQGQMLASELYGYRRGAFTGAESAHVGMVERAQGGTLVFDEAHCLSLDDQAQLLRLLGEREYRPLGRHETRHADVLMLLASNQDLDAAVRQGTFRRDLLDRAQAVIRLPDLWERPQDTPELVDFFVAEVATQTGHPVLPVDRDSLLLLERVLHDERASSVRQLRQRVRDAYFLALAEGASKVLLQREPTTRPESAALDIASWSLMSAANNSEVWRPVNVDARAHALACQALRHLFAGRKFDNYSDVSDATRLLMRSALWSVSGASSQAEFRAHIASWTGAEPPKATVHQLFNELTRLEPSAPGSKGTTVALDISERQLLQRTADHLSKLTKRPLSIRDAVQVFGRDDLLQLLLRQLVYVADEQIHAIADNYRSQRDETQPLAEWIDQQQIRPAFLQAEHGRVFWRFVAGVTDVKAWARDLNERLIEAIERVSHASADQPASSATIHIIGSRLLGATAARELPHPQGLIEILERAARLRDSDRAFITSMRVHERWATTMALFDALKLAAQETPAPSDPEATPLELAIVLQPE